MECAIDSVIDHGIQQIEDNLQAQTDFLEISQRFQLLSGRLYHLGKDNILRLVVNPNDYHSIMHEAHISSCGFHLSVEGTIKQIASQGYWWPTLREDVAGFANNSFNCKANKPVTYATLYHVQEIPQWSTKVVRYLKTSKICKNVPKHR